MPKTVAVVQARMTSKRLPGKVLVDLAGKPVLFRVLQRLYQVPDIDDVVVATTTNESDDVILPIAEECGARWHRGQENDVLARYVGAAHESQADIIVRVTADNPLLDPGVVTTVCRALSERANSCDYAGNKVVRSFPLGLDTEVLSFEALQRADRLAETPSEREHVTLAIYSTHPNAFQRYDVIDSQDNSDLRWTLDYPEDLLVMRAAYQSLGLGDNPLPFRDVVAWFRSNPEICKHNAHLTNLSTTVHNP
jgi:spore coat polysaccharide biosynthesis protein SpsF